MKKLSKILCFILAVILAFATVSCGAKEVTTGLEKTSADDDTKQDISEPLDDTTGTDMAKTLYPALLSYLGEQKWGYIDDSCEFIIEPRFTVAYKFQPNGLAVVMEGEKMGLIDKSGSFLVEPKYFFINDYFEGLAVAQYDEGYEVLDETGKVISERYSYINNYKNDTAVFAVEASDGSFRYGYLDRNGKVIIEPIYEHASDFEKGRAIARLSDSRGNVLIDEKGMVIKEIDYEIVWSVSDGMCGFFDETNNKYGYMNIESDIVIPPLFTVADGFEDGTAVVSLLGEFYSDIQYGLIDKKANYIIEPKYKEIIRLGEDRLALGLPTSLENPYIGTKYALATTDGAVLTDFIFNSINDFKDGMACVDDGSSTYFIDREGNRADNLPLAEGIGVLEQAGELIHAVIDQREYYMNRQGDIVYAPSESITLDSGIKLREQKSRPNKDYLVFYPALSNMESPIVQESINKRLAELWIADSTIKKEDVLEYSYEGEFQIGFNKKNLLELMNTAYCYYFGAAHGMPVKEYVHIDIKNGDFYTLKDLFKEDGNYIEVLDTILKENMQEEEYSEIFSFDGISDNQAFYLTEDSLVIFFSPYEIAPYAAGFPEFEIPFGEISDIIDTKGSFWLSFN